MLKLTTNEAFKSVTSGSDLVWGSVYKQNDFTNNAF